MLRLKRGARLGLLTVALPWLVGCGPNRQITLRELPSTASAITALKRGWADAVVGDYPAMVHTARESMETLEIAGPQFATGLFGIGVSKSAPPLNAALTDALRRVMSEPTYMAILRSWALQVGKVEPPPAPASVPDLGSIPQLADGKLHVGAEMAFPPMEFYDELKKPAGADVELALALGKTLGVQVEFVNMNFDALILAVESGQVDTLISAMTITKERSAQIDFIPYLEMGSGILVTLGNPQRIRRPQDLCGKNVALQQGTAQLAALKQIHCE